MTIEATLERIAVALEKIAAGGTALSTGTVTPTPTKPAATSKPAAASGKTQTPATTPAEPAASSSDGPTEDATSADGTATADLSDPAVVENLRKASGAAILAACKPGAVGKPVVLKLLAKFGASGNATIPVDQIEEFTRLLDPVNADELNAAVAE